VGGDREVSAVRAGGIAAKEKVGFCDQFNGREGRYPARRETNGSVSLVGRCRPESAGPARRALEGDGTYVSEPERQSKRRNPTAGEMVSLASSAADVAERVTASPTDAEWLNKR
jgi:hypothetical protein